ncbi:MAG: hypothetical protein AW06_002007 [Candidatus Accumulibacter cognatus]|uniref:Uncharacterized protein n=1 Tax=Candidatus Accumulibacter cognatus TaxID=2954383 RepID=A0A080M6F7_9PROT|nr:MAG: hypothetical protein AW06_002007 [Candidatus Accumulibacter cognatus]
MVVLWLISSHQFLFDEQNLEIRKQIPKMECIRKMDFSYSSELTLAVSCSCKIIINGFAGQEITMIHGKPIRTDKYAIRFERIRNDL